MYFCLKIFLTLTNSADPDKMSHHANGSLQTTSKMVWLHMQIDDR